MINNDNLIILDEFRSHRVSSVVCENCEKEWEAVHIVETTPEEELKKFECPYCRIRGYVMLRNNQ